MENSKKTQVSAPADGMNCTRVKSTNGSSFYRTIRDCDIEKLAPFIASEEAAGNTVTTERGMWSELDK